MKTMKKLLALVLALTMVFALSAQAFALEEGNDVANKDQGSITLDGAVNGTEYKIYRLLDLVSWQATDVDPDDNNGDETNAAEDQEARYSYKLNDTWHDFFVSADCKEPWKTDANPANEAPAKDYFTFQQGPNGDVYVAWAEETPGAKTVKKFIELALDYANAKGDYGSNDVIEPDQDITYNGTNGTISNLPLGWYLVDSSLGSLCSLNTTDKDAVITEKNKPTTPDKKTQKEDGTWVDENTSEIGETRNFRITIPASEGGQYVVHDRMTSGLKIENRIDIKVYKISRTNAEADLDFDTAEAGLDDDIKKGSATPLTENTEYTLTFEGATHKYGTENPNDPDNKVEYKDDMNGYLNPPTGFTFAEDLFEKQCTFCMSFSKAFQDSLTDNDEIVIIYKARITDDARIGGDPDNDNDMVVKYGDDNYTDVEHTDTETYSLNMFKFYKDEDGKDTALAGTHFALYKEVTVPDDFESAVEGATKTVRHYLEVKEKGVTDAPNWEAGVYHPANLALTSSWSPADSKDFFGTDDELVNAYKKYDMVTDANGFIRIEGLDEGTYYLEETRAVNGYNKLVAPIKVVITRVPGATETEDDFTVTYTITKNDGTIDTVTATDIDFGTDTDDVSDDYTLIKGISIENKYGPEMPVTGGMGTTLFYVIGSIMMIGAAVILVAKKRTSI